MSNGDVTGRISDYLRANVLGLIAIYIALGGAAWAAGQIGSADIRKGAVGSKQLKNRGVMKRDLKNGAVTGAKIDPATVQIRIKNECPAGAAIRAIAQDGTVGCGETSGTASGAAGGDLAGTYPDPVIAAGAVDALNLAPDSVSGPKIANGSVSGVDVADNTLTGLDITDATVTGADVTNGTVTGTDIDETTLDGSVIQKRVTGTCGGGTAVASIAAGGAVTCTIPGLATYALYDSTSTAVCNSECTMNTLSGLAAGTYVVMAKIQITSSGDTNFTFCHLTAGSDVDESYGETFANGLAQFMTLPLMVVHAFASTGSVTLSCADQGVGATADNVKIIAFRVG